MPTLARIKKLPWGILSLEFIVVVLGILGALAVDSWWTDRGDRETETEYLIRLHRDLKASRDTLEANLEDHLAAIQEIRAALEELRTEPDSNGLVQVVEGLKHSDALDVWFPYHTTYEELVATGNLALIQNESLRQVLGTYDREIRNNQDYDEWLEDLWVHSITPVIYRYANVSEISREKFEHRDVPGSPFEMDVRSFYGNRDIWTALSVKLDAEEGISEARGRALGSFNEALTLVQQELISRGIPVG